MYPYRCTQCGHRFEKIQSFSAEPEKTCPKCGGPLERLLTAPGLSFKGAGWYVNDYASKSSSSKTESSPKETTPDTKTPSEGSSSTTSSAAPTAATTPAATTN